MTTLVDVRKGDTFLVGVHCTAADQVTGLTVTLFGPDRNKMADGTITPAGVLAGQLVNAPNATTVQLVTGLAPVSVGDLMENQTTGETAVVRWTTIRVDGTIVWSSSVAHLVQYPTAGWSQVGHIDGMLIRKDQSRSYVVLGPAGQGLSYAVLGG